MKKLILSIACILVAFPAARAQEGTHLADSQSSPTIGNAGLYDGSRAGSALDRRVTLDLENEPLGSAIATIAGRAGVGFIYSEETLPAGYVVTLHATDMPMSAALERMLKGTKLTYSLAPGGYLMVKPAVAPPVADGRIAGRVTSAATGAPISDVYVVVEGADRAARTDANGRYSIGDLDSGTYTVSVRRLGFAKASKRVIVTGDSTVHVDFALAERAGKLDQVVVTSTVAETRMREVPVDVTVITAEQMREKNIVNIEQLFRGDIPGVFIEDQGYLNTDPFASRTPQVRGQNFLSAQAGATSFLKTYIDGILVTDYSVVAQLDPGNIERIEVVRGPAATTLYGSGASDGVMQIFTKHGSMGSPVRTMVSLSGTAFDSPYVTGLVVSPRIDASVNGGGDEFSYSASAALSSAGEYVPHYKNTRRSIGGGVRWQSGPVTVALQGRYDGPNVYNSPPDPWQALGLHQGIFDRAKLSIYGLAPTHRTNTAREQMLGGTVSYQATPGWTHTLTFGLQGSAVDGIQDEPDYTTISDTLLNVVTSQNRTSTLFYSNTWDVDLGSDFRSTLTTGLERTSRLGNYSTFQGVPRTRGSLDASFSSTTRSDTRNTGYFGQWVVGFKDAIFITTGLRAEDNPEYGDDVGLQYAPRFGASIVKDFGSTTVKLRGSYGWSSRPPDPFQKDGRPPTSYTSGNTTYFTHLIANPELLPSENRGGDFGVDLYFGDAVSLSATYFNQYADRDIYQTDVTVDTTALAPPNIQISTIQQFLNIGKVQTRGVELHASVAWKSWMLTSTYTAVSNIYRSLPSQEVLTAAYGHFKLGRRIGYIPAYNAMVMLARNTPGTQVNIQAVLQGRFRGNDQATAFRNLYGTPEFAGPPTVGGREILFPKWTKYNFNLTQRVFRNISAYLSIQNLLDSELVEGYDNRMPLAGRTFTLGTRWANF